MRLVVGKIGFKRKNEECGMWNEEWSPTAIVNEELRIENERVR